MSNRVKHIFDIGDEVKHRNKLWNIYLLGIMDGEIHYWLDCQEILTNAQIVSEKDLLKQNPDWNFYKDSPSIKELKERYKK